METKKYVFGEKLKNVREAAGMSQEQLASKIGGKQVSIARWEGGREPRASTLVRLAGALNCKVDDIV